MVFFGLLPVSALRLDFTGVSGMWLTACQLINVAVECCFFNPRYLQEIKKEYIPALIQESLNICRNIVKEYQTTSDVSCDSLIDSNSQ